MTARILWVPKSIQMETAWLEVLRGLPEVRHYVTPLPAMWNFVSRKRRADNGIYKLLISTQSHSDPVAVGN